MKESTSWKNDNSTCCRRPIYPSGLIRRNGTASPVDLHVQVQHDVQPLTIHTQALDFTGVRGQRLKNEEQPLPTRENCVMENT